MQSTLLPSDSKSQPVTLTCGHTVLDPDQVHYCTYIQDAHITALLEPKDQQGNPRTHSHPEEFQFILVHQACELSFSGCLYELDRAISAIQDRDLNRASELVSRCRSWINIASRQLQHLVDHLTPEDFGYFRESLSPASGAESIRFRLIEIGMGIRPDSPYVTHRNTTYTYRQFLDRSPVEGQGRPKTNWWTDEMSTRADQPTLASAFNHILKISSKDQGQAVLDGAHGVEQKHLAEQLCALERALLGIRKVHMRAAIKHISEQKGTGHTDGVAYLSSVHDTARCFPLLSSN